MSGSVVPALIDALVVNARANLANVNVFYGFGVTQDPGDMLLVGADDWDGSAQAAEAQQTPGPFGAGRPRDENGSINLIAISWNGNADQKAARDGVYAITRGVEAFLRTNPSLGVSGVLWTGYGPSQQLTQEQGESGATAYLSFSISFRARI